MNHLLTPESYKEKLGEIDGVTDVTWLDDAVDVKQPLETQDTDTVETYYKDGNALFSVTVDEEKTVSTVEDIRALIGEDNAMTGAAVNTAQAAMTLDAAKCKNIVADQATIANVGANKQLSYIILPGKGADLTIKADVMDFEMDAISINGVKLNMDMDVDDSELTDQVKEIRDAITELNDGAKSLDGGADSLDEKAAVLKDGTDKLKDGMDAFGEGMVSLKSGTDSLCSGAASVKEGAGALTGGATEAYNGSVQVNDGAKQVDGGMTSLNKGINDVQTALTQLNKQSNSLTSGSMEVKKAGAIPAL